MQLGRLSLTLIPLHFGTLLLPPSEPIKQITQGSVSGYVWGVDCYVRDEGQKCA